MPDYILKNFPTESGLTSLHFTADDICNSEKGSNLSKVAQIVGNIVIATESS